jgi:hypothetical protein
MPLVVFSSVILSSYSPTILPYLKITANIPLWNELTRGLYRINLKEQD